MQFSKRRDLREKLSVAMATKCTSGKFDNRDVIKRIVSLNHERAQILGYEDYAEFVLEKRMAKDNVLGFMFEAKSLKTLLMVTVIRELMMFEPSKVCKGIAFEGILLIACCWQFWHQIHRNYGFEPSCHHHAPEIPLQNSQRSQTIHCLHPQLDAW